MELDALRSLDDAVREVIETERADSLRGPDSPEGREMGALVGANVVAQRARRALTLDALAVRSGISPNLLACLEEGMAVPSLRAVWALATALRVPFGRLLARPVAPASGPVVVRADRGRRITSADGAFGSRALSPSADANAPEVYEITLAPGCIEHAAAHAPETFEHIVVVRGTLVVEAGGRTATLRSGDAVYFRADEPHTYRNPATEETVAHLVMTYA